MPINIIKGNYYLTTTGEVIRIDDVYPNSYLSGDNRYCRVDIVAEVPVQLHYEIVRITNQYHTNNTFKMLINTSYYEDKNKSKGKENGI